MTGTLLAAALFLAPDGGEEEDLRRRARSILAENCFDCHGPDSHGRKGDLRLDVPKGVLSVVEPGSPEKSELYARITAADPDEHMPPAKSKRRLNAGQIEILRKWIGKGAPWGKHWSFVPPERAPGTIDGFVRARLKAAGLDLSPEADRRTLLRRLHLDLTGLPPAPEESDAFAADAAPDAVERVVDRLLASPHFGERWGRHWLDLARYGDSDGFEDDRTRPDAWRYRDWVIDAVDRDLPFDRFTVEQLAGDLLPGATPEQKTAAGFHRMAAFNRIAVGRENEEEFRVKGVKERVNTTASVWLGLTAGCAECHDHKYDPIPQRDYYRLYAFFNSLEDAQVAAPPLPDRYRREYEEALRAHDAARSQVKVARDALDTFEKEVMPSRLQAWAEAADRGIMPADVAAILAVPPAGRSAAHLERLTSYFRTIDAEYLRLKQILLRSEGLANNKPDAPSEHALTVAERATPRPTRLQVRGNYLDPGPELLPGVPDCVAGEASVPDRLALARWIASPSNPLTARVAVNHVWKHLFGTGLVPTADNFGVQGQPPSHPELLDALAVDFVRDGWSRKRLIRAIVTSAAYRQASRVRPEAAERDPDNRLLHRQNRLRVEAEIVRDLGLAAAGLLNPERGGPAVQPRLPASLLARSDLGSERLMMPSRGADLYRRGVYVNVQRTFPYPMLRDFDAADANDPCLRRDRSVTPQQALTLLNDPVFAECAVAIGRRVLQEGGADPADRAFRICLSRPPNAAERRIVLEVYEAHRVLHARDAERAVRVFGSVDAAAWAAAGRVLLNTDEFITRE
jgi:mono/diheme cytochrome c family protein